MHNTHISAIKITYTESFYVDSSQIFHPKEQKKKKILEASIYSC